MSSFSTEIVSGSSLYSSLIEGKSAIEAANILFKETSNQFAGSELKIDPNLDPEVALAIVQDIIDVFDGNGDPDFKHPAKDLSQRAGLTGAGELFISLIDLGILGNLSILKTPEGTPFVLVTANITSLSCGFKAIIINDLTDQIADKLSRFNGGVMVQDQYEEFIYASCQDLEIDDAETESKVQRYQNEPAFKSKGIIEELAKEFEQAARDSDNETALLNVIKTTKTKFPQNNWINPASIPAGRIEKFELFKQLSELHPDVPFMAGALIRAVPIAKFAPQYQQAVAEGRIPDTMGSLTHALEAHKFLAELTTKH